MRPVSAGLLYEEPKQYPVLYEKQMKREKKTKNLLKMVRVSEFVFHVVPGSAILLELRRIGKLVLFSRKNDQEGWMESEVYLQPSQTPTMDLFLWKWLMYSSLSLFLQNTSIVDVRLGSKYIFDSIQTSMMELLCKNC